MRLAPLTLIGGLIRLVHPFPILLDGIASGAFALLAGGDGGVVVRLGVAMLALQASIGVVNDVVDAPDDAVSKPDKPIPAGRVPPRVARAVAIGSAGLGLLLAALSGPWLLFLAAFGLAIGYGYDLVAKGTPWSWVPFAIGIPLLPVFGWYGAAGSLPTLFALLVPLAIVAGAELAIANAIADTSRDRTAGVGSVAIRLGPRRAWAIGAALQVAVGIVALGSAWVAGAGAQALAAILASFGLVVAGLCLGRSASPILLERAWEVQAVGIAVLAVSWLWGMG
ncbi:MAG: UbiA prenyltransferase family protein [Chloroflexi bacterium]|nr:UbiA prenyltransferase family protein [Chloroflexota bacterium]